MIFMEQQNTYEQAGSNDPFATNPADPTDPVLIRTKHSGPGIASFVIGLVALLGFILTFFLATIALSSALGTITQPVQVEEIALHPAVLMASLFILVCLVLNLAGLILGVIGLVLRNRKKVFPIIGTILNGIMILTFAGLILAGIYMT